MLENIQVWKDSRVFVVQIYKLLEKNKDWGFKDQIQRAAVSIMNNIAEGQGYESDTQFLKFLSISNGSCYEVKSMLYLCADLGYCSVEESMDLIKKLNRITYELRCLMGYLRKKIDQKITKV